MKLWKYVLCPFYISFAPYIVLSMLIFWAMGCSVSVKSEPGKEESVRAATTDEFRFQCSNDLARGIGDLVYRCVNKEATCYVLHDGGLQCFKTGDTNESCKFPQPNK